MAYSSEAYGQAYLSPGIVAPGGTVAGALLVRNGKIEGICRPNEVPAGYAVNDLGTAAILPGLVDTHVHINEPGRTEWEGYATATRAAAAGGYTLLVDMPLNCLPETTTVAALEIKREAAEGKCLVDWAAWGGAVADNQADLLPLARAGVPGYKCFLIYPGCDGFTMIDRQQLEAALPAIAESGLPLLVHAELAEPIDAAVARLNAEGADWRSYATYLASRPDEAELQAIRLMVRLCREYGFRLHIVHLATALALPELAAAKAEGLPITVETCPHYLVFAAEQISDGATDHKCAPPIRSEANREGLWQGLRDGIIDLVATDHSPCPPEMKRLEEGRFDRAWGGIASLSVAFSAVWTEAAARGFLLEDVCRWMSAGPARLAGMTDRAGSLTAGHDASFVVFDSDAEFTVEADKLHFRHKVSPYVGKHLKGVVQATYLRGERIFGDGAFAPEAHGQEQRAISKVLRQWNWLSPEEAARAVLPCNGSATWAELLAFQRPIINEAALLAASDSIWRSLPREDWQQAFDSHPRIGEKHAKAATGASLNWSSQEQSKAVAGDSASALAAGNAAYEAKFGRIFLICASGRSASEILSQLERRMHNDPATELAEAAEQQRQITTLRLKRWLGGT